MKNLDIHTRKSTFYEWMNPPRDLLLNCNEVTGIFKMTGEDRIRFVREFRAEVKIEKRNIRAVTNKVLPEILWSSIGPEDYFNI